MKARKKTDAIKTPEEIAIECCHEPYSGHGGKLCSECMPFAAALRERDEAHEMKREQMSLTYASILDAKDKAHETATNELGERAYKLACEHAEEANRLRAKVSEYIRDDTAQYEQVAEMESLIEELVAALTFAKPHMLYADDVPDGVKDAITGALARAGGRGRKPRKERGT